MWDDGKDGTKSPHVAQVVSVLHVEHNPSRSIIHSDLGMILVSGTHTGLFVVLMTRSSNDQLGML
jgi:hypothetical protein